MGILDRNTRRRRIHRGAIASLLLAGAVATGCNRSVDGEIWVSRPAAGDTGWTRLDPQRDDRIRSLLQRATNRDLQAPDPAAAASGRRIRWVRDDTLVWQGGFLPPNCVVSDTDSYCVARDDSDAVWLLREVFR